MNDDVRVVRRYRDGQRMNHWVIVLLFVLAAASGLAFFHPSLYWLSGLVGGGSWARILHPFLGVLMLLGFVAMFVALWRDNVLNDGDRAWLRESRRMLRGDKDGMPAVGKYNAGQKLVFWATSISLLVLLVTGIMFWRPYFDGAFPIPVQRVALLLHAIAAVVLVIAIILHVYAAIWVRGTMRAMTRGTVTESWAQRNHPQWYADVRRESPRP
jgi:formate dehydrogenase subunit gamma